MQPFGFGQLTGIDLEGELTGVLPSSEWKERRFHQKWYGGETISIGIGQGYNSFTLLQLAHATATLANGGVVMKPHVVRAIEDPHTGALKLTVPSESGRIKLNPHNLEFVRNAMVDVNLSGTGRAAFAGAPYRAAGKTGTAQVVGIAQNEKYNESRIDERHREGMPRRFRRACRVGAAFRGDGLHPPAGEQVDENPPVGGVVVNDQR